MIDFYKEYGNVFAINVKRNFYLTKLDLIGKIIDSGYKDKLYILESNDEYLVIAYDTFNRRAYDLKDFIGGRHCCKLDTFSSGFFLSFIDLNSIRERNNKI